MGYPVQQSTAAVPLLFLMIDSSDHIAGKTGLSPTVTISKNGAAFAAPAGAVTELAYGWYRVAANATDADTLGPLKLHATASGADPCDEEYAVVAFNPYGNVAADVKKWNGGDPPTSFEASNMISDYQQRSVAVTLPAGVAQESTVVAVGQAVVAVGNSVAELPSAEANAAAVSAEIGGQLDAIQARTDLVGTASVAVRASVSGSGRVLRLVRGDSYLVTSGDAVRFTFAAGAVRDLSTAVSVRFTARSQTDDAILISAQATVAQSGTGTQIVDVELEASETQALPVGDGVGWFDVEADFGESRYKTLISRGILNVDRDETRH